MHFRNQTSRRWYWKIAQTSLAFPLRGASSTGQSIQPLLLLGGRDRYNLGRRDAVSMITNHLASMPDGYNKIMILPFKMFSLHIRCFNHRSTMINPWSSTTIALQISYHSGYWLDILAGQSFMMIFGKRQELWPCKDNPATPMDILYMGISGM